MKLFIFPLLLFTLITHQSALADNSHASQVQTDNSGIITIVINDLSLFGGTTYFDYQSNTISREIWQDPNTPVNLHAAFNRDMVGNPTFTDRRVAYLFSSDYGENWTNMGSVTGTVLSTYPCISGTNDGRAIILCNSSLSGGNYRAQIFLDLVPGIGVFQLLDPGAASGNTYPFWPVGAVNNNNKIFFLGSTGDVYRNSCTNITPPGIFTGYSAIPNTGGTSTFSIAASGSRIGIAYVTGLASSYSDGSVLFMESTNSGSTWGTPVQIWNANYSTDSIGGYKGVDVAYLGSSPKVVFDLCKRNGALFNPKSSTRIMSWSPDVNGGVPVIIDSSAGYTGSNPINDMLTSDCRAVIGATSDSLYLCAAWCKARSDTNSAGINYFDIWFAYSFNGGLTWVRKTQITNNSGPLRDCRYVSVSPINRGFSYYNFTVHLLFQSDSVPGSYVNGSPKSLAKMMFGKVEVIDGIKINSSEIPVNYILYQNYPNPFNPTTTIEYGLSKSANVNLTVYDMTGRKVKTLVHGFQSAGYHSAVFETKGLASGVYFYRIEISEGNKLVFTEAKKMLLVK